MPGEYTIHLGPNIQPVQHAWKKVFIESREKWKKNSKELVDQHLMAPVTQSTEWVSVITNPTPPEAQWYPPHLPGPHDQNRAILQQH